MRFWWMYWVVGWWISLITRKKCDRVVWLWRVVWNASAGEIKMDGRYYDGGKCRSFSSVNYHVSIITLITMVFFFYFFIFLFIIFYRRLYFNKILFIFGSSFFLVYFYLGSIICKIGYASLEDSWVIVLVLKRTYWAGQEVESFNNN